jgi:transcription antitermination protein NusB
MSPRHLSRAIILQALFMWDFNGENTAELRFYLDYNLKEAALSLDEEFIQHLAMNVATHKDAIDKLINEYTKEWPVDRLTIMDRSILRIALFEMFNETDVPTKVSLNEAVELAKEYSGTSSQKFVSGVLGSVYEDYFKNNEKKPFRFGEKT